MTFNYKEIDILDYFVSRDVVLRVNAIAGTYLTTDPNKRVKLVFDDIYPSENPAFPYAPGVLEDLQKCFEEGNYYGAILEEATVWTHEKTGDKMRFWDETDSIWGCAGYENPAEEIAKEFFGVTVTEKI